MFNLENHSKGCNIPAFYECWLVKCGKHGRETAIRRGDVFISSPEPKAPGELIV